MDYGMEMLFSGVAPLSGGTAYDYAGGLDNRKDFRRTDILARSGTMDHTG